MRTYAYAIGLTCDVINEIPWTRERGVRRLVLNDQNTTILNINVLSVTTVLDKGRDFASCRAFDFPLIVFTDSD